MKQIWVAGSAASLAILLVCLNYFTPPDASPEWIYTLEWINPILILCLLPCAALLLIAAIRIFRTSKHTRLLTALALMLCGLSFALPILTPDSRLLSWQWQYVLSGCWALGFLLAGILLFMLASRSGSIAASLLCLAGSLFLGLATMEGALLFSSQPGDGMMTLSAVSKHAQQNSGVPEYENWTDTACGGRPAPAGNSLPSFHRHASFAKDIFDVQYTFNEQGRRITPAARPDAENDLLLFGCSFTFGFGLEDEQTWAWQLAKALGPDWQVENYGANGYSANHMLCMLERGLIDPPLAKSRYALFLALDQHLRRNEFFTNTPHYQLDSAGNAEAGGQPAFNWVYLLPATFNGSQLAREASSFITGAVMRWPDKHVSLYLAMLKKSARLLADKYNTRLIVLIWPGLEEIAPELNKLNIPTIMAQSMLPEWDTPEDPGWKYRIDRYCDPHPNWLAAASLAKGLAGYFLNLANRSRNKK